MEIDSPFIPGVQEEWKAFAEKHGAFLQRFSALTEAANAVFDVVPPVSEEAPFVVFGLVRQAAQDYLELLLLAANGYGLGALKLLRGMYERVVVARWLHLHPDETKRFLAWEVVQRGKLAKEYLRTFEDTLGEDQRAGLRKIIEEGDADRDQFMVADCKRCGTRKLNHTWTTHDLVSMARAVGGATGDWLGPAYYEPLKYLHATASSLGKLFTETDGHVALAVFHRQEAEQAVMLGHYLLLNGLELLGDARGGARAKESLEAASKAYKEVWGLEPPTSAD